MSPIDLTFELTDPSVKALFRDLNKQFFKGTLGCEVKWSHPLKTCAGICDYHKATGNCAIRLSMPLLKKRTRKDVVETLLHQMIHAYLFLKKTDHDRNDHDSEFQSHVDRINKDADLNISMSHPFDVEIIHKKVHHWRCDGPCRQQGPNRGWVMRAENRPPGPNDSFWDDHQRICGGIYIKVSDLEVKKAVEENVKPNESIGAQDKSDSNIPTQDLSPLKNNAGFFGNRLGKRHGEAVDVSSKPVDLLESKTKEPGVTLGKITTGRSKLLDLHDKKEKSSPKKNTRGTGSQWDPIELDDGSSDKNEPNYGPEEQWQQVSEKWLKEKAPVKKLWESIPDGLLDKDENGNKDIWKQSPENSEKHDLDVKFGEDGWETAPEEVMKQPEKVEADYGVPQLKKIRQMPARAVKKAYSRYVNEDGPDYEIINCPKCNMEEYKLYMPNHLIRCTK